MLVFLMEQNISIQEYCKIILYLYQLKYIEYFSGTTLYSWKSIGTSEYNIENIP